MNQLQKSFVWPYSILSNWAAQMLFWLILTLAKTIWNLIRGSKILNRTKKNLTRVWYDAFWEVEMARPVVKNLRFSWLFYTNSNIFWNLVSSYMTRRTMRKILNWPFKISKEKDTFNSGKQMKIINWYDAFSKVEMARPACKNLRFSWLYYTNSNFFSNLVNMTRRTARKISSKSEFKTIPRNVYQTSLNLILDLKL